MTSISLRPADPDRDFVQLAAWFTILEDVTNTEAGLREYYDKEQGRITHQVAEAGPGELLGFYWATRDWVQPNLVSCSLYVSPEQRRRGVGRRLYAGLLAAMTAAQAGRLRVSINDAYPADRAFAERRGFTEHSHSIAMRLDLAGFDDRPYDAVIARLRAEGFEFTSMGALGNTEEAQRRLYELNETTSMETPGTDGAPSWASFEDFQRSVCQSAWYRPDGQMVVIDTATGVWAAMSAISRFGDYACNLHTGVDRRYRGRKLAQAVKVLALRYAREVLGVATVRTNHNSQNAPMIAIDRKFGYVETSGVTLLEKVLDR
jgi:GNAT superfamily N-acetyltransferase